MVHFDFDNKNWIPSFYRIGLLYLIVLGICFIFGGFRRMWNIFNIDTNEHEPPFIFAVLHILFMSLFLFYFREII